MTKVRFLFGLLLILFCSVSTAQVYDPALPLAPNARTIVRCMDPTGTKPSSSCSFGCFPEITTQIFFSRIEIHGSADSPFLLVLGSQPPRPINQVFAFLLKGTNGCFFSPMTEPGVGVPIKRISILQFDKVEP